ncbi:copper transporter [Syntrophomonas erecta]
MIDLRYHIASIVAVFLALGVGVLIGSTIVGDDLLVDQQKKMIDRLEEQFYVLRERENNLVAQNQYQDQIINNYENYSQALLPPLVQQRLEGYRAAVVVTGGNDVPGGMLNAISVAGAGITSKAVVLEDTSLQDPEMKAKVISFYGLENDVTVDALREQIAASVAAVILNKGDAAVVAFLQENGLVKFSGNNEGPINGVIVVGGATDAAMSFITSFDKGLITALLNEGVKVFGVETSTVPYSYMEEYQKYGISTIDNVDMSPGQISLVYAMEGEPGNYGIKRTAKKFMPALPADAMRGQE